MSFMNSTSHNYWKDCIFIYIASPPQSNPCQFKMVHKPIFFIFFPFLIPYITYQCNLICSAHKPQCHVGTLCQAIFSRNTKTSYNVPRYPNLHPYKWHGATLRLNQLFVSNQFPTQNPSPPPLNFFVTYKGSLYVIPDRQLLKK